jgi:hypothetical protein
VKVNQYELVMPPTVTTEHLLHTVQYSAKAILSGHGSEVLQLTERNFLHRYARPGLPGHCRQQKTAVGDGFLKLAETANQPLLRKPAEVPLMVR